MFRIAAIVILSAATTLTAVGWVWSYVGSFESHSCFGPEISRGWSYMPKHERERRYFPTSRTSSYLIGAMGRRGSFHCITVISPRLGSFLPCAFRVRPYRGLDVDLTHMPNKGGQFIVTTPFWLPFLLFVAYPAYAITTRWVVPYQRRRFGKCVACGYSLIGNESGTCPECGQSFSAEKP
jgi:hypothetical protein